MTEIMAKHLLGCLARVSQQHVHSRVFRVLSCLSLAHVLNRSMRVRKLPCHILKNPHRLRIVRYSLSSILLVPTLVELHRWAIFIGFILFRYFLNFFVVRSCRQKVGQGWLSHLYSSWMVVLDGHYAEMLLVFGTLQHILPILMKLHRLCLMQSFTAHVSLCLLAVINCIVEGADELLKLLFDGRFGLPNRLPFLISQVLLIRLLRLALIRLKSASLIWLLELNSLCFLLYINGFFLAGLSYFV